jgi:hypothetical protein
VSGPEKVRVLARNFSIQQLLADPYFAEDGGACGRIKSRPARLIGRKAFVAGTELKFVESRE